MKASELEKIAAEAAIEIHKMYAETPAMLDAKQPQIAFQIIREAFEKAGVKAEE